MRKRYLAFIALISLTTQVFAQGNLTIVGKNLSKHPMGQTYKVKMQNRGNNNNPLFRQFPIVEGNQRFPLTNGEAYYSIYAINPNHKMVRCYQSPSRKPYVTVNDETEMTILFSYNEQDNQFTCELSKTEMDVGEPDEAPSEYNQGQ